MLGISSGFLIQAGEYVRFNGVECGGIRSTSSHNVGGLPIHLEEFSCREGSVTSKYVTVFIFIFLTSNPNLSLVNTGMRGAKAGVSPPQRSLPCLKVCYYAETFFLH